MCFIGKQNRDPCPKKPGVKTVRIINKLYGVSLSEMSCGKKRESRGKEVTSEGPWVGIGCGTTGRWLRGLEGLTSEQGLEGECHAANAGGGWEFQAEAPARAKAQRKDSVARLTE